MKILVVDDQAANRGLLSYLLEEDGHEVIEAASGLEGIDQFAHSEPDLVLLDVMMPGMDGYQTAEKIKAKTERYVPIIFLTALSDDVSLSRCIESGGDDFLTKPVNETLLTAKIKAHERIRELNHELTDKNNELQKLHSLLKQEHDLAEYVFESAITEQADCGNVQRFLSPMGGFSGDLILTARTRRKTLFVLLGDFTGHGLPAALGALPVSQDFHSLAKKGVSLGELASKLNQTLYNYLPSHMFCAASIIELSEDGLEAEVWIGGLPDMYLIDTEGLIRKALRSNHLPLGVLSANDFMPETQRVSLRPNERLLTYSDGVTDCCNVAGEMLGEARFEQMFDGSHKVDDLFPTLVQQIKEFGNGRAQDDDISMLVVLAKPLLFDLDHSNSSSGLDWVMDSSVDLSVMEEGQACTDLFELMSSRWEFRVRREAVIEILEKQLRYVIDHTLLGNCPTGADMSQTKRDEALKNLPCAKLFARISHAASTPLMSICLSDRPIPADTLFSTGADFSCIDPLVCEAGLADDNHCLRIQLAII